MSNYYPAPPQKKRPTALIILAVVFGAIILMCGGCLAVVGLGASEVDKAIDEASESSAGKKSANEKTAKEGRVGNWEILNKNIQFREEYGMFATVKLRVKNISDKEDEPWLEIRLTNKAGDLVTTFDCIGRTVESGQTTTLDCTSLDDFAPFTKYEIKNAF